MGWSFSRRTSREKCLAMFIAPKARNSSRRKSSRIAGRKYAPLRKLLNASGAGLGQLSLAKIKSACEINNIRRHRVTWTRIASCGVLAKDRTDNAVSLEVRYAVNP